MFAFKSVGHFFATFYSKVVADLPKIQKTEGVVETVTATVPVYGTLALPFEKLGYAILGEVASVLAAGNAASHQHLADAGLDIAVIDSVKQLVASYPSVAALALTLKK